VGDRVGTACHKGAVLACVDMKKLMMLSVLWLASASGYAGDDNVVQVNGTKNPDMRSYRSIVAGLDAFDAHHDLAPAVPEVRFRLDAAPAHQVDYKTLSLRIVGDSDPIPLTFADDGTFTVPRVQSALDDNADLVLNRKKGELQGRPVIRTPGLPANVRRLGDLRLECEVEVAIARSDAGFFVRALVNTMLMTSRWCTAKDGKFWFRSPGALSEAFIVEGDRREPIGISTNGYLAPLGDSRWTNEARVELALEPELTAEEKAHPWQAPLYLMGSMNNWTARNRLLRTDDGQFKAELLLNAGRHEFKIGGSQFIGIDLGGSGKDKQVVATDMPVALGTKGSNLVLTVDKDGRYAFFLDASDTEQPRLTVTRVQ